MKRCLGRFSMRLVLLIAATSSALIAICSTTSEATRPSRTVPSMVDQPKSAGRSAPSSSKQSAASLDAHASRAVPQLPSTAHAQVMQRPKSPHANTAVTSIYDSIMASSDDPDWTRRTERSLEEFAWANAASAELEPVLCRSEGCILSLKFAQPGGQASLDAEITAWQLKLSEFKAEPWNAEFATDPILMASSADGRPVLITLLRRRHAIEEPIANDRSL